MLLNGFHVEHEFPNIGLKTFLLNARRLVDNRGATQIILLAMNNITNREADSSELTPMKGVQDGTDNKTAK